MSITHKKAPSNRQAVLDNVTNKHERRPGGFRDLFGLVIGSGVIHREVRVMTSRSDEDDELVPLKPHAQRPKNGRLVRVLE